MASYTQYQQYGGNPYANAPNTGGAEGTYLAQPPLEHEMSNLSATSNYSNSAAPPDPANSRQDPFLNEVTGTQKLLQKMSENIAEIRNLHDRSLNSPEVSSTAGLEALVTETQRNNAAIRDRIKSLQADASRSRSEMKVKQANLLRDEFQTRLTAYNKQEMNYRQKYKEQIERQYRIVYPSASEAEVKAATEQNWSNEGIFQQALRDGSRSRQVNAAASAVLTRHNDIQQIEKTITELAAMFAEMAQIVEIDEPVVQRTEENAIRTADDMKKGNVETDKAIEHARRRNRLKRWCLLVVVLILLAIGLGVGLGVGLTVKTTKNATS